MKILIKSIVFFLTILAIFVQNAYSKEICFSSFYMKETENVQVRENDFRDLPADESESYIFCGSPNKSDFYNIMITDISYEDKVIETYNPNTGQYVYIDINDNSLYGSKGNILQVILNESYEIEVVKTIGLAQHDEHGIGVIEDYDLETDRVKIMDHDTKQIWWYDVHWGIKDDLRPKLQFKPNIWYEINDIGEIVIYGAYMTGFFGENESTEEYPMENIIVGWYGSAMKYNYDQGYEVGYDFGREEVENGASTTCILPEMWMSGYFFIDGWEYGYYIATGVKIDYVFGNGFYYVDGIKNYYDEAYESSYHIGLEDAYQFGHIIDENSISEDERLDFSEGWRDGYIDGYTIAMEHYENGLEDGYKVGYEEGRDDATMRQPYDATSGYSSATEDILTLIYREGWYSEYAIGYDDGYKSINDYVYELDGYGVGDWVYVTGYGNSNSWSSGNYTRYMNNQYMEITKIVDSGAERPVHLNGVGWFRLEDISRDMVTTGIGISTSSSYSNSQDNLDYLDISDGYMIGDTFFISGYAYENPDGSGFTSNYIDNELASIWKLVDCEYSNFIYVSNYGWISPRNIDSIPGVPSGFSRTEEIDSLYHLRLFYKMDENTISVSVINSRIQNFIINNPCKAAQTLRDLYVEKGYSNWDLNVYSVYDLGLELAAHALITAFCDNNDMISNGFEVDLDIIVSLLNLEIDTVYNHSSIADCGLSRDWDANGLINGMKIYYKMFFGDYYWKFH